MTCSELDGMIANLSTQLGNLNQQISDKEGAIVGSTPACLSSDVWGGSVPTAPLSLSSVTARIAYLQGLFASVPSAMWPALMNTIASYMAIKSLMDQKADLMTQADTVRAQLNALVLQKANQGCP